MRIFRALTILVLFFPLSAVAQSGDMTPDREVNEFTGNEKVTTEGVAALKKADARSGYGVLADVLYVEKKDVQALALRFFRVGERFPDTPETVYFLVDGERLRIGRNQLAIEHTTQRRRYVQVVAVQLSKRWYQRIARADEVRAKIGQSEFSVSPKLQRGMVAVLNAAYGIDT